MIRNNLKKWLSSVFELPIVEEFNETKVEQEILFNIVGNIETRIKDGMISFSLEYEIIFRCPIDFAGIGFLTLKLSDSEKKIDGLVCSQCNSAESVEYASKTEMIIKKKMSAKFSIEYNKCREKIKIFNIS